LALLQRTGLLAMGREWRACARHSRCADGSYAHRGPFPSPQPASAPRLGRRGRPPAHRGGRKVLEVNLKKRCLLAAESAAVWQAPHLEAHTTVARRRVDPYGMPVLLLGDRLVGTSMLAATRTERCTYASSRGRPSRRFHGRDSRPTGGARPGPV